MAGKEYEDIEREQHLALIRKFERMVYKNKSVFIDQKGFDRIIEHYIEHFDYPNALNATTIAIEQHPFSSQFHFRHAQLKFEAYQFEEAIESVRQAKILDAQNSELFVLESEILTEMNRPSEALDVLNDLLEFVDSEQVPETYMAMADVYAKMENDEVELQYVKMALVMNPDYDLALERIMMNYEELGNYGDGIEFHKKILDESPFSFLAWNNLGNCYYHKKQYEKAIDAFSYALAIEDNHEPSLRQTAECYYSLDLFEKAIEFYRECQEVKEEEDEYLFYSMGLSFYQLSNFEKAAYYLNKCLDLDEEFADVYFYLGKIFQKMEKHERAINYIERALVHDEDSEEYTLELADLLFQQEKFEEAFEMYERLCEINPEDKDHWLRLINRNLFVDEFDKIYELAKEALEHLPDDSEMMFVMAICSSLSGKRAEASEWAQRSCAINSTAFQVIQKMDSSLLYKPEIKAIIAPFVN